MKHIALALLALLALPSASKSEQRQAARAHLPETSGRIITLDLREFPQIGTVTLDGLTVTFKPQPLTRGDETLGFDPVIEVASPGYKTVKLRWYQDGRSIDEVGYFRVGIGQLNQSDPVGSLIAMQHSGGAHCCWSIKIVQPSKGKLVVTDAGNWDGAAFEHWEDDAGLLFPRDRTGDGIADFVMKDGRFNYTYTCYACSVPIPLILNFAGGHRTDVSDHLAFRPLFEQQLADVKLGCIDTGTEGQEFANLHECLAYAALAARLGQFEHAYRAIAAVRARAPAPFMTVCTGTDMPCTPAQWRAQPRLEDTIKIQLRKWRYPVTN